MTERGNIAVPSHHVESKIEPGTVFETYRNVTTGTVIETMRRNDRQFVAVCTNHGQTSEPVPYREHAHRSSRFPQGWCKGCQRLLGITKPNALPEASALDKCDGCGDLRTGVVRFGHIDAEPSEFMALCKTCWSKPKIKKVYYARFSALISEREQQWRGLRKEKRAQIRKRLAMTVNQRKEEHHAEQG